MLGKLKNITVGEQSYPLAFTLNVMENIQEKYGSMDDWGNILGSNKEEPSIKDLKWTFKELINEGIDIENEEKEEKRSFITDKQVGRIISDVGMSNIKGLIMDITVESTKSDKTETKNV